MLPTQILQKSNQIPNWSFQVRQLTDRRRKKKKKKARPRVRHWGLCPLQAKCFGKAGTRDGHRWTTLERKVRVVFCCRGYNNSPLPSELIPSPCRCPSAKRNPQTFSSNHNRILTKSLYTRWFSPHRCFIVSLMVQTNKEQNKAFFFLHSPGLTYVSAPFVHR